MAKTSQIDDVQQLEDYLQIKVDCLGVSLHEHFNNILFEKLLTIEKERALC